MNRHISQRRHRGRSARRGQRVVPPSVVRSRGSYSESYGPAGRRAPPGLEYGTCIGRIAVLGLDRVRLHQTHHITTTPYTVFPVGHKRSQAISRAHHAGQGLLTQSRCRGTFALDSAWCALLAWRSVRTCELSGEAATRLPVGVMRIQRRVLQWQPRLRCSRRRTAHDDGMFGVPRPNRRFF